MTADNQKLKQHFGIQSVVDLDFVIGQRMGIPVGMRRNSSPEFRRRVLAAAMSYQLGLASIDYALKRYVKKDEYEEESCSFGNEVSDYLRDCTVLAEAELKTLHTQGDLAFGVFGAEITLYKIPHALDTARMLSNRGILLEVLPILRLCLEMIAWAQVAFRLDDEDEVTGLKAHNCISNLKATYRTAGNLYGYLSKFTHWGHVVHGSFIHFEEEQISILKASVRYRAMSLGLCLVMLDVLMSVVKDMYGARANALIQQVQGGLNLDGTRNAYQYLSRISDVTRLDEMREIQQLIQ